MHMSGERQHKLTLDVVMIARNQEWNVRRLIESVIARTANLPVADVILVDSASTDRTVDLATLYPIRVIRLRDEQRLTAAAGRHAGLLQTDGDVVLFLDGDMELCAGWADAALALLERDDQIAAVSGQVIDQPANASSPLTNERSSEPAINDYDEVQHGGGAAAYRRDVLAQVGSFNPFLFSDEEPELCLRIRQTGYRIARLRQPIAYHYSDPSSAIATLFARRKRNLYLGPGQALRLHLRSKMLLPYARERGFGLAPAAGIAAGLACVGAALANRDPRWALAWIAGVLAVLGADALRRQSLYRALFSMVQRLLFVEGTLRGFFMQTPDSARFPYLIEVVK